MKKYTLAVVCILIALITGIGGMLYTYKPPVKISVIMSTYNRAPALPVAIESILKQTFNNFEFIIINDGSTDNSADVIKGYAQKDPRIVYLENKENKGLVYGLNRGLDIARGEYIARMDDDDESFPRRFEKQLKTLDSMPEITVLGTASTKSESIPDSPLLPTPIDPR
ncbi:MAG: glycosyltransferase, partial [Lactobacillales bacterium]|nr:glycosyltransferase [Lactobacillales bacterium]